MLSRKMKIFYCFVVLIFVILFGGFALFHPLPDYERIANGITDATAKSLESKIDDFYLIGTGGRMMHNIQMMEMSFVYYHEVDIQTARELLIYVINTYLKAINENKEVRPYLHEYPFTPKNVEIHIWIYEPDRSKVPRGKIEYVSAMNGLLKYYEESTEAIYKETFEEALKKVEQ